MRECGNTDEPVAGPDSNEDICRLTAQTDNATGEMHGIRFSGTLTASAMSFDKRASSPTRYLFFGGAFVFDWSNPPIPFTASLTPPPTLVATFMPVLTAAVNPCCSISGVASGNLKGRLR